MIDIENTLMPQEHSTEMEALYTASFDQYKEIISKPNIDNKLRMETVGASDILAWILEIPQASHNEKKKEVSMPS